MFGFVIGTACLVGLVSLLRGGFGPGRHSGHLQRWGGFGPRRMLRRLFTRLDTTPSQEKVITSALTGLMDEASAAQGELKGARGEVASALRQDVFDEVLLGAALTRIDNTVDLLRKAALDAFGKVHAALDDRQRKILADLLERGPQGFRAHPYRL